MSMTVIDSIFFALRVYGIVIVISFLCAFVIWAVVHTLSAVAKKEAAPVPQAKPAPAPAPVQVAAPSAVSSESVAAGADLPLEHVAAIAAAVASAESRVPLEHVAAIAAAVATLTDGATVLRIEDSGRHTAWVAEGRLAHHSSHSPIRNR